MSSFVMTLPLEDHAEVVSDGDDEEELGKMPTPAPAAAGKRKKAKRKRKPEPQPEEPENDFETFVWEDGGDASDDDAMESKNGRLFAVGAARGHNHITQMIQDRLQRNKFRLAARGGASDDSEEEEEGDSEEEEEEDEKLNSSEGEEESEDEDEEEEEVVVETKQRPKKGSKAKAKKQQQQEAEEEQEAEEVGEEESEEEEEKTDGNKTTKVGKVGRFDDLSLSRPLLKAVRGLGFTKPTPVQWVAIPKGLAGRDLLVNAVTGSGKTAAFMLPVLERLLYRPRRVPLSRVLVLTPTRELASQIVQMTNRLAQHTDISTCLVVGGLSAEVQQRELRHRPDIVVATPGRLIDHLRNTQAMHLEDVEVLVLDEADRLLELGFVEEINEVVRACPRQRQTMLFSATLTSQVNKLVELSLERPVRISVDSHHAMARRLTQEFVRLRKGKEGQAEAVALSLCQRVFKKRTIVFVRSKEGAHRYMLIFGLAGLKAGELHGNLTQAQRLQALEVFREGKVDYLIATDLAARGLDIQGVETVINTSLPRQLEQYIHRVGRTARAGKVGHAVTLCTEGQRRELRAVVKAVQGVKSRTVNAAAVSKAEKQIARMANDIKDILLQEKEEKALRIAEMEANKSGNMIKFSREIAMRPARTWFQTEEQRKASKEMSANLHDNSDQVAAAAALLAEKEKEGKGKKRREKKKDPLKGLSRKKKRRKIMLMEMEQEREEERRRLAKEEQEERERVKIDLMAGGAGKAKKKKAKSNLPPTAVQIKAIGKSAKRETFKTKQELDGKQHMMSDDMHKLKKKKKSKQKKSGEEGEEGGQKQQKKKHSKKKTWVRYSDGYEAEDKRYVYTDKQQSENTKPEPEKKVHKRGALKKHSGNYKSSTRHRKSHS